MLRSVPPTPVLHVTRGVPTTPSAGLPAVYPLLVYPRCTHCWSTRGYLTAGLPAGTSLLVYPVPHCWSTRYLTAGCTCPGTSLLGVHARVPHCWCTRGVPSTAGVHGCPSHCWCTRRYLTAGCTRGTSCWVYTGYLLLGVHGVPPAGVTHGCPLLLVLPTGVPPAV